MQSNQQAFDTAKLKDFKEGKESAFDQLFRAYHAPLTHYAWTIVKDEVMAEDVVQDCFLKLWERRRQLNNIQSFNSYLYRMVHNASLNAVSRNKLRVVRDIEESGSEEPVESSIIASETMREVLLVLDQLPPRMREIMVLHYVEGKSMHEVGAMTGTSYQNARTQRYRALQVIRHIISSAKVIFLHF